MKCIVCDKCKEIIKNPRLVRVITCARPLRAPMSMEGGCVVGKPGYRGNDRQQNDIFWEKEICDSCLGKLEAFFEDEGGGGTTEPDTPNTPDTPDVPDVPGGGDEPGGETPTDPDAGEETPTP